MIKKLWATFLLSAFCITSSYAEFDQRLIDEGLKNCRIPAQSGDYKIRPAIQLIQDLAYKLTQEEDVEKAKNIADTLLVVIRNGQGVGGVMDPNVLGGAAYANSAEQDIMIKGLGAATYFMFDSKDDSDFDSLLNQEEHIQENSSHLTFHQQAIDGIRVGFYEKINQKYNKTLSLENFRDQPTQDFREIIDSTKSVKFNSLLKARINKVSAEEVSSDYENALKSNDLKYLTDCLAKIVDEKRAATLSDKINDILKNVQWKQYLEDNSNFPAVRLEALILLEKYRLLETQDGVLKTANPDIFDYQEINQDKKSTAILMAMVSAIQDFLFNPQMTIKELVQSVCYKKNSHLIKKEHIKKELSKLLTPEKISKIITPELLELIRKTLLNFNIVQKLKIDEIAVKQRVITYTLDGHKNNLYHFRSAGKSNQCGFFSLGLGSREEAYNQILDNLGEPEILAMADKSLNDGSDEIKASYNNSVKSMDLKNEAEIKRKAELERKFEEYFNLYKKNGNSSVKIESFKEELRRLIQKIAQKDSEIDTKFEQNKGKEGILEVTDQNAEKVSQLRQLFEWEKFKNQAQLLSFIYPKEDLRNLVRESMNEKFKSGMLEFDPNPDFEAEVYSYPKILAVLNNYNIRVWADNNALKAMEKEMNGAQVTPISQTADGLYSLVNVVKGGKRGKPITLINQGNGHFEKWISRDDYPQLASAIRHNQKYSLGNTGS